ncbi:MAG TPA: deoxyguanosinetriphosphate triphosphohydrolase [Clostridiales bacterium]|jgi:dGTPase|nr:deoxyguanosinetriphosphate triphosphohydrolase [Clostridiales bacterium]
MLLREQLEQLECERLSPYAAKSAESKGRITEEEPCTLRTDYQRDRDRIIHSKSLRRLMHKTQVFLAPEGDHFRTRLTHTLEVAQIARTCARALNLNEDLTEAIAMGHDLGHTPFGHSGETFLNERHARGFAHNVQSLRVVDVLDLNPKGRAMNLTREVRDGILNHTGSDIPFTLEGQIVKISDRIAYVNHDIDDAIRGKIISSEELPQACIEYLGQDHRTRIDTLVRDLVASSDGKDQIHQSPEARRYMNELRDFMFERVYHNSVVKKDSELDKIRHLIFSLYDFYLEHPDRLPQEQQSMMAQDGPEEVVKDHIANMTDRYAINIYTTHFVPAGWKK